MKSQKNLKQYTIKEKLKYIKLYEEEGLEIATIQFLIDNEAKFHEKWRINNKKFTDYKILQYARNYIKTWYKKYYNEGIMSLKSKTGKAPKKGTNSGRPKKITINDLTENDRQIYQEIMESILEDWNIPKKEIVDRMKKRKAEKKLQTDNLKYLSILCGVNRTSIYKPLKAKNKKPFLFSDYEVDGLNDWIMNEFEKSGHIIGRDKMYQKYRQEQEKPVSSYIFRIHHEHLGIKSKAYIKGKSKIPKEIKFTKVWSDDLLKGDFNSEKFGDVLHADIKYIKIGKNWFYLHVIIENNSNMVLNYSLSKSRLAVDSISLVQKTIKKFKIKPKIFHSDHGVEYANYQFKNFLESKNIKQSMSPKGKALGNRPSEYFFANIQREKLDFYNFENSSFEEVIKVIDKYIEWYNNERPQSCLKYKTPESFSQLSGACAIE